MEELKMADVLTGGFLSGKKTYLTAIVAIIGAISAYVTGEVEIVATFQVVITALSAAGLKSSLGAGGFLKGYKTYITAFSGLAGAIALYLTGDAGLFETFQTAVLALSAAGLRSAVAKK
jgi:hypothetical protein